MGIELYSRSQQSDEKASTRLGNHLGRSRGCYFGLGSHFLSQFGQLDPCRQVGAAVTAKHRWGSSSEQSHKKASTRLGNHLGMLVGCSSGLGSHFLSQFGQLDPCRQVGAAVAAKHRWGSSSEQSHRKASTRLRNHLGMLVGCSSRLG